MRYIKVKWRHSFPDDPIVLYSEIDEAGWEVRKVEVFRDGQMGFAGGGRRSERTMLGEATVPSIMEIAADSQFEPEEISQQEFESVWQ